MEKFEYFFTEEELKEQKKKEIAKASLLQNTVVKEIYGVKIAVVFAPAILPVNEIGNKVLNDTGVDVQIAVTGNAMTITSSKYSTENSRDVAELFGGIGCKSMAWATYPRRVTSKNFREVAEEIFEKLVAIGGE